MALIDDLNAEVGKILAERWTAREGRKVPEPEEVTLGNDAVQFTGTVLYADLAESTDLVTKYKPEFVAKVYKCYLNIACRIIRERAGVITAFDGDRVMAVFLGDTPNTGATSVGLALNHAVSKIINPALRKHFQLPESFAIRQAVGIDTSELFIARTGVRKANDLVWVGRAANYAAKLCALREGEFATWITKAVFDKLPDSMKLNSDGRAFWEARTWTARNESVYRSNWWKIL